ncbi:uncharacterized protein MELLADRAFT_124062 [Melampsora larici-populina 98AG31]|uniref:Secreted protein n=1 Tax=Melampsora larici-populina (strain 98AG31 / pathotype 3-4-7) TaxID=747676 RepID=F4RDY9_MELLP|nr:uncharacterized protein MELLADRAFT_124062 [Melampsora larici-populina 98AG31]EGG09488.1 hypothetical protein MELLADRAFT_124062 [Melampsora larici-populina 98AG31]
MPGKISQNIISPKLSLAINCLLWLSRAPEVSCNTGELASRQVYTDSELNATQGPIFSLENFHGSSPHGLEKRKNKNKNKNKNKKNVPKKTKTENNFLAQDDKPPPNGGDPKDPQNSQDLSPLAVQEASKHDGKEKPEQAPSLTSPNNFINFCISGAGKLGNAVIQNGAQTKKVNACNGIPMGMIPAPDKTPSLRFFSPKNLDTVPAKKTFTVSISVKNLEAGHFTAPLETYFAAPITLNEAAVVIGHTHIVAQRVESLTSTALLDPREFKFFKGIDSPVDKEGKLHAEVKDGLEKGVYRFSTMTASSNHQPIAVAVAQHDSMDDVIYITVN